MEEPNCGGLLSGFEVKASYWRCGRCGYSKISEWGMWRVALKILESLRSLSIDVSLLVFPGVWWGGRCKG
jgi:hypothetical protein